MTIAEALDIMVARTNVARYRELCDPDHPHYAPEYVPWIVEEAQKPFEPPSPESRLQFALAQWWAESERYWRGEPTGCGACPDES